MWQVGIPDLFLNAWLTVGSINYSHIRIAGLYMDMNIFIGLRVPSYFINAFQKLKVADKLQ